MNRMQPKNIAIILAGGSGLRLGSELPKQFLKVAGKKIIEHTILAFENNVNIDEIAVVTRAEYVHDVEQMIIVNEFSKVKKVLIGGAERYHSSLSAINAYTDDECNLIFHDAVRPLVNNRIINDCVDAIQKYDAIDVAIKATDTIIKVNFNDCIDEIPNRASLRCGQTPQCFKRRVIAKAYEKALKDPQFRTTDDCGVVRKYLPETPIYVVDGEVFNIKVTYTEDLFLLDKLFQLKKLTIDNKHLTDTAIQQLPNKVMVVFGGSYGIGAEVVKIAREMGCVVYSFSRSENHVDVTDYLSVERVLREIESRNGHIDYVVNTAGVLVKEPLINMTHESIEKSLTVNYLGVVNVAKASFPYLKKSHGSIAFYTSSSYTKGRMMYSIYSSTKAAIVNLVQALCEEWSEFGIRINCINPERTKTPMRVKAFGNEPDNTLLNPQFVGIATLNTLTSDITGEVIDVRR